MVQPAGKASGRVVQFDRAVGLMGSLYTAYIRKELLRNEVTRKLFWTEYMEECRLNGDEPLMYSQFCYHIQQDEQKHRDTMHINHKPGEQVEVD